MYPSQIVIVLFLSHFCQLQLYTIPYVRKSVLALNSPADDLLKEEEEWKRKVALARNPVHNVSRFIIYATVSIVSCA